MTNSFTLTNIGLLRILQYGANTAWYTLDNSTGAESRPATAPASELSAGGAGRQAATVTDISSGNTIALKLTTNYEFSASNAINAICLCWAGTAGANMIGRGLLAATQNVGAEDTVTLELELGINQVS